MTSEEFYQRMFKRCNGEEVEGMKEVVARREREGIYAICGSCGNPIYQYMTENKEIYDILQVCGTCATGESAVYVEEVNLI